MDKKDKLAPFTEIFEQWLNTIPKSDNILFPSAYPDDRLNWNQPLNRSRIMWIVKKSCGMFPHWFRGVHESIYGRLIFESSAWNFLNSRIFGHYM